MANIVTILVIVGSYIPGYKGGGPIRSIASLVDLLGDEFHFKIITSDHDLGDLETYPGVIPNTWSTVGKAEVYYASKSNLKFNVMSRLLNSIDYDILYLNSFFSFDFSIKPLLLRYMKITPNIRTILAPRGEFSPGALKLKRLKKELYISIASRTGLYNNILWQASSNFEKADIEQIFNKELIKIGMPIIAAPDLASHNFNNSIHTPPVKNPGVLEIAFLSRISPKKNLEGALLMLNGIQGDITFNIFGPIEDLQYWQVCQTMSSKLDANIKVVYRGEIEHSCINEVFNTHHLFFFPTFGENFGHVILESLLFGCPVLLSDQTPWRDLDSLGIGWDLPLDKPDKFKNVLKYFVDLDQTGFNDISRRAKAYGKRQLEDPAALEQNRHLFQYALNSKR